jgi:hypothetical protein
MHKVEVFCNLCEIFCQQRININRLILQLRYSYYIKLQNEVENFHLNLKHLDLFDMFHAK